MKKLIIILFIIIPILHLQIQKDGMSTRPFTFNYPVGVPLILGDESLWDSMSSKLLPTSPNLFWQPERKIYGKTKEEKIGKSRES